MGWNGAGKTTLYERVIGPETGLPFVNADEIARTLAEGGDVTEDISVKAAKMAAKQRDALIAACASFVAETVFSHPSKIDLVRKAQAAGYTVQLHVVVIPVELAVARVRTRVTNGGHRVPEDKIRDRHKRLWSHVAEAVAIADETVIYDNSNRADWLRPIARFSYGVLDTDDLDAPDWPVWPDWAPPELIPPKQ